MEEEVFCCELDYLGGMGSGGSLGWLAAGGGSRGMSLGRSFWRLAGVEAVFP
jgi:hypothetical protein